MLQIQNELSFLLHNHGNLRRQKNSSPSVSIPTTRNSIYLQHFRETRNWYRHELTIDSNGSTRGTHKRKLHCMVLDTRMQPFYSKQELPSKKSKLDWDIPVQKLLWISTLMSRNPRSRKQPRNLPIILTCDWLSPFLSPLYIFDQIQDTAILAISRV